MARETEKERREREARERRSDEVDAKLRAHPNFFEDTDTEEGVTTITFLGRSERRAEESAPGEESTPDDKPAIPFELDLDFTCKHWPMPDGDED